MKALFFHRLALEVLVHDRLAWEGYRLVLVHDNLALEVHRQILVHDKLP